MHPYSTRYAMTNAGPVMIRTKQPITSAKGKRIIAQTVVCFPNGAEYPLQFKKWMRMIDTWGWVTLTTIYDESLPA